MTRLAWAVIVVSLLIAMIASCVGGVSPPLDLPTSKPETLVEIVEVERKVVFPVTVPVPVTVEVPMRQTVLVEKFVEVPATVEVTREVAATVEVTREVTVEKLERVLEIVDRAVTVEVVKQTTKYIEVPTTVEVPIVYEIEVTREVPVTVEVIRDVEVPVEKFVPVKEFATVEIEIEVEVTRIVDVHRVVTATPTVTPTPKSIFAGPFPTPSFATGTISGCKLVWAVLNWLDGLPSYTSEEKKILQEDIPFCDLHGNPIISFP